MKALKFLFYDIFRSIIVLLFSQVFLHKMFWLFFGSFFDLIFIDSFFHNFVPWHLPHFNFFLPKMFFDPTYVDFFNITYLRMFHDGVVCEKCRQEEDLPVARVCWFPGWATRPYQCLLSQYLQRFWRYFFQVNTFIHGPWKGPEQRLAASSACFM